MNINNQNGFTIVQAIFILVVLALLGTYMVRLSTVQQSTSTQALLQARAYQAARAGLEWGVDKVTEIDSCVSWTSNSIANIEGFCVDVTCEAKGGYVEGTDSYNIYNITSVAKYSGSISSPDYVSRTLEVTIHD